MSIFARIYTAISRVIGVTTAVGAAALLLRRGVSLNDAVIIGLVVPTTWVRINLEPKGYVTLAPLAIFTGLLFGSGPIPVLVSAISPLVGTFVTGQRDWVISIQEAGGEAIAALAGIALVSEVGLELRAPGSGDWLAPFALAAAGYILMRFVLAAVDAKFSQGVGALTFVSTAGKSIAGNLSLLALLAVGVSYLAGVYGRLSSFVLALSTIAVVEAYNPFKQLSDQRDVLFARLSMLAHAIDLKDAYTRKHAREAADIAVRIARALRLPEPEVRKIKLAGMLHDIGKIGVSRKIIRKPSGLTSEEMMQMRKHPVIGAEIMRPVELLADASEIVRHHHEHFDGSGYPDGLRGDQIPIGSRIVLVADAFHAITTDRSYRKARNRMEALEILKQHAGTQFDPKVVEAFGRVVDLVP